MTQTTAYEPSPARTLYGRTGGIELLLERIKGVKVLGDSLTERIIR